MIPFASFCAAPGRPGRIGFNAAMNCADAAGTRIGRYQLSGDGEMRRDAALIF